MNTKQRVKLRDKVYQEIKEEVRKFCIEVDDYETSIQTIPRYDSDIVRAMRLETMEQFILNLVYDDKPIVIDKKKVALDMSERTNNFEVFKLIGKRYPDYIERIEKWRTKRRDVLLVKRNTKRKTKQST